MFAPMGFSPPSERNRLVDNIQSTTNGVMQKFSGRCLPPVQIADQGNSYSQAGAENWLANRVFEKRTKLRTPGGRFELPRCQAPVAFKATALPD
jgi:hypothetical protein